MDRTASTRKRPRWIFLGLLVIGGFGVGLILAEVGLIIGGVSNPQMYFPDDECGSRLHPGLRCYCSKEGAAHVSVNRFGFRDREWEIAKPVGTLRIAMLGDSYIEAVQVERNDMFGAVLERELNASPPNGANQIEVMSFGVSGWSTTQELLALRTHVWQFDPDIVVLAFLAANDIRGNSKALEPDACRPFAELVDGALQFDMSFRTLPVFQDGKLRLTQWKSAVINSSRVLQVLQLARTNWRSRSAVGTADVGPTNNTAIEAGLDVVPFIGPRTAKWSEAWEITARLIGTMSSEVQERGKRFVVMTVTSGQQVHPDPERRAQFARSLNVSTLNWAERAIDELGDRLGFERVLLAEPLAEWATQHNQFLHGFRNSTLGEGHWNEHGHREAARRVAASLRVDPRRPGTAAP